MNGAIEYYCLGVRQIPTCGHIEHSLLANTRQQALAVQEITLNNKTTKQATVQRSYAINANWIC